MKLFDPIPHDHIFVCSYHKTVYPLLLALKEHTCVHHLQLTFVHLSIKSHAILQENIVWALLVMTAKLSSMTSPLYLQLLLWATGNGKILTRYLSDMCGSRQMKMKFCSCFWWTDTYETKHYVFMDYIFKQLTERLPKIKIMNIFSDGAGSQFKQRFLFSNLYYWKEHPVSIVWNFFVTSHGKGVVDRLGGTVKRQFGGTFK